MVFIILYYKHKTIKLLNFGKIMTKATSTETIITIAGIRGDRGMAAVDTGGVV